MGTTLEEPLYYVNSTRTLAHMGLRFYSLLHTHSHGEKFSVDIECYRFYFGSIFFYSFRLPIDNFIFVFLVLVILPYPIYDAT